MTRKRNRRHQGKFLRSSGGVLLLPLLMKPRRQKQQIYVLAFVPAFFSTPDTTARGHTPGTRMEIRTWRSAIADLKGPPPGAPSGALGDKAPLAGFGGAVRRSRAITENMPFCAFLNAQPKHQNCAIFANIEVFSHVLASRATGHRNGPS